MNDNYKEIIEYDEPEERGDIKKLYKVYSCVDEVTYKVIKDMLTSKGISTDKVKEIDGNFLLTFTLYSKPDTSILTCSGYEWMVDEYKETILTDGNGSGEFKFEKVTFYRCNHKNIPVSQTFNDFDSLLQLYPVHYGTIRIKELNEELERWIEKIDRIESNMQNQELKEDSLRGKQQWETYLLILKNKVNVNLVEIKFIKEFWETLNNKFYGYKDKELALRYRGIDPLSPLTFNL